MHNGDRDEVLSRIGLSMADLFDTDRTEYGYSDGRRVIRFYDKNTGKKRFAQGGNKTGTALFGVETIPDDVNVPVAVVEGEKDVRAFQAIGVAAVSPPQGANTDPARFDWTPLAGRPVLVVRDMDEPGLTHAQRVFALVRDICDAGIVEPAVGKDAADHIAAGLELGELRPMRLPMPDGVRSFSEVLGDWWQWLHTPASERRVFSTPWAALDDHLAGGLHPRRTYIFAGRPGAGKTVSALNIAQHVAERHAPTLVVSLEMPDLEMASRLVAAGSQAHYGQITRRQLDSNHARRVQDYMESDRPDSTNLWMLDKTSLTIEQIRAYAEQMQQAVGLGLLVIDHIGLIKQSRNGLSRREAIGHASWQCSVMAKDLDIVVLLACQLNRGTEQENRPPVASDLKESGDIEQNADVVCLLHHPKINGEPTGDVEIRLGKNRTGPHGAVVTLPWRGHMARIG
ncbi:DnaB-like helicase C-terminal domain-containing protein [Nocardia terpenica]|uniref:DnaB-like helicase C-terminal domain-containing protein n=1 Tax=Nocardia terpenica TaxID=455432 RepID=UPI0015C52AB7|nr:DnaB-like helicase C-terminal domain-containing protein [Nocardia terpenica]NQE89564.1 AAA family ATPase [Nocardia terpenica]